MSTSPSNEFQHLNITLGTAGHIDHGKTALVTLLTGCNTDRLKEERDRGMSIELGFAPCRVADLKVGIVDVPGHENFIKTMVAGASGMDAVMLVVAADDGVMPQTREHMEILTLLGVKRGFVALTKIDRVDAEHLELVLEETQDFLRGTFLEGAPIQPVSSITGDGFDGFHKTLTDLLQSLKPKPLDGVFRLPVDRSFSAQGYGTIVAGIPVSGQAKLDDELELLPERQVGSVRAIEVYGQKSDTVSAGQCAAINMRRWDAKGVKRGHVVATPGYFASSTWFVARLRLLPQDKLALKSGTKVKFHSGTTEATAAVYPLEQDRLYGGNESLVQFRTETPVVAGPGDHFIIRSLSPVRTIGGGLLIEPVEKKQRKTREGLVEDLQVRAEAILTEETFVEYALQHSLTGAANKKDIGARTKLLFDRAGKLLDALVSDGKAFPLASGAGLFMHVDRAEAMAGRVVEVVETYHKESPQSPGISLEELRSTTEFDRIALDGLLVRMKDEQRIIDRNGRFASPQHSTGFDGADAKHFEAIEKLFRAGEFRPPTLDDVARETRLARTKLDKLISILREHERLIAVEGGILFHCDAVAEARRRMTEFIQQEGCMESVKFKYLLDTSRKFAIPLLDHFDLVGVTRRSGKTRYLKNP
jgi:selenocysteine-specific elongation factor